MTVMTGDVLNLNEYKTYGEYKEALDGELQKSAESFVRIGYLLKVARDTDILTESGYRSVNEFAEKEYNLDKSQVSRFIRINDEFSENGYSDRLQEHYRSFGYAKLAMMLLLPAEINEELSSSYSKAEIQAIREEVDEERKITDLEVMMEEKDERQQDHSTIGKVIHQLGRDNPEMYVAICCLLYNPIYDGDKLYTGGLMDVLAPAGEAIISVRIAGEGKKMLSIKGLDADPVLVDVRSGKKQACTWEKLFHEMEKIWMNPDAESAREAWEILYGEPFPEKKAEVAPVQPKKEQSSRKVSKVTKAKKPEKTPTETVRENAGDESGQQEKEEQEAAGVENEESRESKTQGEACADSEPAGEPLDDPEPADEAPGAVYGAGEDSAGSSADGEGGAGVAPVQPESEKLKGQMNIQDFPEYMPEAEQDGQENIAGAAGVEEDAEKPEKTRTEEKTEAAAGVTDAGAGIKDSDGMNQHIGNQKKIIKERLQAMGSRCDEGDWDGLIEVAKEIITRAESIKNMVEVWNG